MSRFNNLHKQQKIFDIVSLIYQVNNIKLIFARE